MSSNNNNNNVGDFVKNALNEIKEMSTLNQILVGGSAGLATGYVLSRVGKLAAFTIGSGVLVLQVAQHLGYIEIKWGKRSKIDELKKKALKAVEETGIKTNYNDNEKVNLALKNIKKFFKNNVTFGVSFGGGVLIGFSV